MKKKGLILTFISWIILTLTSYYYMNVFISILVSLVLTLTLLVVVIIQVVNAIIEIKTITKLRIAKLVIFSTLFILTLYEYKTNRAIESIDWIILENRRTKIVEQVKEFKLNPNVSWNNIICELPFEFPVVSNGGNDIAIYRNKENRSTTVEFYILRNFFTSPSIYFVYTDNTKDIELLDIKVSEQPENNWKIKNNWYRIRGD